MDYSSTINLPKTAFPMKAGLKEKEPKIIKKWEEEKLYQQLRELRKGALLLNVFYMMDRLMRMETFILEHH